MEKIMIELICFFFPAALSVFALERLLAKKLNLRNFLMVFVTNTLLINIVGLFIMFCITSAKTFSVSTKDGISINLTLVYDCSAPFPPLLKGSERPNL